MEAGKGGERRLVMYNDFVSSGRRTTRRRSGRRPPPRRSADRRAGAP